jgi:hypothetical protein
MTPQPTDPVVSAQVLMKAATRAPIRDQRITSENIASLAPSRPELDAAVAALGRAGLEIGPVVGSSFSITAPRSTFDRVFGTHLTDALPEELPLGRLPATVRSTIEAITFSPPPDFGPGHP